MMNHKEFYQSKKYYLKGLAQQLHDLRLEFKESQRNNRGEGDYRLWMNIQKIRYEYRHQHIANTLARKLNANTHTENGVLTAEAIEWYNRIEAKVKDGNEANFDYIGRLSEEYPSLQEVYDETSVCVDA